MIKLDSQFAFLEIYYMGDYIGWRKHHGISTQVSQAVSGEVEGPLVELRNQICTNINSARGW
jgi:hypothetical protein